MSAARQAPRRAQRAGGERSLVERGDGLFTLDAPQRFLRMPIGARMSIVRLPGDELLLYSPVALDAAQQQAVHALGRVAWIVAPNLYHHLYAAACARAFPGAQLLASPGLADKRPDVPWSGRIPERAQSPWAPVLEPLYLDGNPVHREVVLYHRPARALIAADVLGNICALEGLPMKLFGWLNGWGRLGPPRMLRRMVRDRAAAARSVRELLGWDIATVIPCHGEVATGVRTSELARDFAWLVGAP